jgi:hypothetical protein
MLKPNANFKLSKSAKRLMAATADKNYSNMIKKNFIQAELASAIQVRPVKGPKKESQGD